MKQAKKNSLPRERFLNLDGSTLGVNPWLRPLTRPSVQGAAVFSLFLITAKAMTSAKLDSTFEVTMGVFGSLLNAGMAISLDTFYFNLRNPISKDAVIDTTGLYTNDTMPTRKAISFFESRFRVNMFSIPFTMLVPIFTHDLITLSYSATLLASAIWTKYVNHKLKKMDWTIQTTPPRTQVETNRTKAPINSLPEAVRGGVSSRLTLGAPAV